VSWERQTENAHNARKVVKRFLKTKNIGPIQISVQK
jgi:hypothetical protein